MAPKKSSAAKKNLSAQYEEFIEKKYIPLNKNIKIAIAAGVIIGLLALFYFVIYSPKQEEIDKLTTTQKSLKSDVDKAEQAASNLPHHKEELAIAQKKFEEISVILPKEQEIPDLLRNISDLGKRAGLDFVSFKPGKEVPKDFYAEIPISIQLLGPYHNIGYFLGKVSMMERLVTVDNIKMSSPKEVEGEMLLNSSCNLLTYRQGAPSSPDGNQNQKK